MSSEHAAHQASAIPFRRDGVDVEFCLITSMNSRKWGFPKGIIDPGETPRETALKESWEEAGLRGRIVGEPLGTYEYRKWGLDLVVLVMLMEVDSAADRWDEQQHRTRCWAAASEAGRLLRQDVLDVFRSALARLGLPEAQ